MVRALLALCALLGAQHDVLIRGGLVYDGSGRAPVRADVAIDGDRIVAVGSLRGARARLVIDARGLAVAPGFINMLSWAADDLLVDGRSLSDIYQGVTLEVFGEGWSPGPRAAPTAEKPWTTLGQALALLERRGVATNVASFVGATTLRSLVVGDEDVDPTPAQLAEMERLAAQAMEEGAMGVGFALFYAPAIYARTPEVAALCAVAARSHGMCIAHIRSEGEKLIEAIDELIGVAKSSGARVEIYHLKAAGAAYWGKLDEALRHIRAARAAGVAITADMYTYSASSTGLSATIAPWAHAGGHKALRARLDAPETRARIVAELEAGPGSVSAGGGAIMLIGFHNPKLLPLAGRRLADIARQRRRSPAQTVVDLLIEDDSEIGAVYFIMSEDDVRKILRQPWVSFGSDASSIAADGRALTRATHPRAYGNFARLLGHYVRDEKLVPLADAIRRLTSLPAANLALDHRGALRPGFFADVVVFDPRRIADHATYEHPHKLATGVVDVLVNGVPVLRGGKHTGATPGRFVRGPGASPR
jgi:N-acyl-D-aspartate/D-glutamate deacylase